MHMCLLCYLPNRLFKGVCLNCYNLEKSNFDKEFPPFRILKRECKEHGVYMTSAPLKGCPDCSKKYNHYDMIKQKYLCVDCGNYADINNLLCNNCYIRYSKSWDILNDNLENPYKHIKIYKCDCGFKTLNSTNGNFCLNCYFPNSEKTILFNQIIKSKHKIDGNLILIDIEELEIKLNFSRICSRCKRDFVPNTGNKEMCGFCYEINTCVCCKHKFINTNGSSSCFCSPKCQNIMQHKNGFMDDHLSKIRDNEFEIINKKIDISPYTEITMDNIDNFNEISGIWFKVSDNVLLDVCLTTDIKEEVLYHFKSIKSPHNLKYKNLQKEGNIRLYFLKSINNWNDGLIEEMLYAIKNKAKYWNPSPGFQSKEFKKYKENLN